MLKIEDKCKYNHYLFQKFNFYKEYLDVIAFIWLNLTLKFLNEEFAFYIRSKINEIFFF